MQCTSNLYPGDWLDFVLLRCLKMERCDESKTQTVTLNAQLRSNSKSLQLIFWVILKTSLTKDGSSKKIKEKSKTVNRK